MGFVRKSDLLQPSNRDFCEPHVVCPQVCAPRSVFLRSRHELSQIGASRILRAVRLLDHAGGTTPPIFASGNILNFGPWPPRLLKGNKDGFD